MAQIGQVKEFELALLVLRYLEAQGWTKTVASFKKEAKDLLNISGTSRQQLPTNIKPLNEVLNEYLHFLWKEGQRATFQSHNQLAHSMYNLLDYSAGIGVVPSLAPPPPPLAPPPLPLLQNGATTFNGFLFPQMQQQQQLNLQQTHMMTSNQVENPLPQVTPGRQANQRKGAPKKRRRLDSEFDGTTTRGGGDAFQPLFNSSPPLASNNQHPLDNNEYSLFGDFPFDLLNRAVDPIAMMNVLDHPGDEINKFSTFLADNINRQTAMQTETNATTSLLDDDFSLTDILKDPEIADFLLKIVGPSNDYGGSQGGDASAVVLLPTTQQPDERILPHSSQIPHKIAPLREEEEECRADAVVVVAQETTGEEGPDAAEHVSIDDDIDGIDPDELEDLINETVYVM